MDVVKIQELLGQAMNHQVTQFGLAFVIAAMIHAQQVRKEIAAQMASVVLSINEVAKALKDDLGKQSERLNGVETGIQKLNTRVEKLENTKGL